MFPIHAGQIKAARAMLNWSQEDLACKARLSLNTVRNVEMGSVAPRGNTATLIRAAIESAGIEFLDTDGVKRRPEGVKIYKTPNSCDLFFSELMRATHAGDDEILMIAPSPVDA